jgi:hypothetical protein
MGLTASLRGRSPPRHLTGNHLLRTSWQYSYRIVYPTLPGPSKGREPVAPCCVDRARRPRMWPRKPRTREALGHRRWRAERRHASQDACTDATGCAAWRAVPLLYEGAGNEGAPGAFCKKYGRRSVSFLKIESEDECASNTLCVMRGLDPRIPIRDAQPCPSKRDGRDKPGHGKSGRV